MLLVAQLSWQLWFGFARSRAKPASIIFLASDFWRTATISSASAPWPGSAVWKAHIHQ
jgi:hypothetical protein